MAGAVLGTCLGGPVGFLAGVKIGGLAAVGGSLFGRIIYTVIVRELYGTKVLRIGEFLNCVDPKCSHSKHFLTVLKLSKLLGTYNFVIVIPLLGLILSNLDN